MFSISVNLIKELVTPDKAETTTTICLVGSCFK